jgi:hypothetical protein
MSISGERVRVLVVCGEEYFWSTSGRSVQRVTCRKRQGPLAGVWDLGTYDCRERVCTYRDRHIKSWKRDGHVMVDKLVT